MLKKQLNSNIVFIASMVICNSIISREQRLVPYSENAPLLVTNPSYLLFNVDSQELEKITHALEMAISSSWCLEKLSKIHQGIKQDCGCRKIINSDLDNIVFLIQCLRNLLEFHKDKAFTRFLAIGNCPSKFNQYNQDQRIYDSFSRLEEDITKIAYHTQCDIEFKTIPTQQGTILILASDDEESIKMAEEDILQAFGWYHSKLSISRNFFDFAAFLQDKKSIIEQLVKFFLKSK